MGPARGAGARFTLPATLLQSLMALGVYLAYLIPREREFMLAEPLATRAEALQYALPTAQTATAIFAALCGLLMILFTVPPSKFWTGGSPLRGDRRPAWLTLGLLVFFAVVLAVPLGRTLFELTALPVYEYLLIAAGAVVWALLTRLVWRAKLLDRFFGVHEPDGKP
jgi:cation-transporting ATPase E